MNSLKSCFNKYIKRNFITNYEAYLNKIKVSKDEEKINSIKASSVFNDPKLQSIFRERLKKSINNTKIDIKTKTKNDNAEKVEMIGNNINKKNVSIVKDELEPSTYTTMSPFLEETEMSKKLLYNYRNNILDKDEEDMSNNDKKEKLKLSRRIMLNKLKDLGSEISRRVGENTIFRYNYKLKDFEGHNPLLMRAMSMDNGSVGEIKKGRIYELTQT